MKLNQSFEISVSFFSKRANYRSIVIICISIFLLLYPAPTYARHPFYISVTEMSFNEKNKSLEISCKMFAEDMEDVLKQNYKTTVDLGNSKMQTQNNKLISDYILKHLSINIDLKAAALKFVGFEKENESVYCYLEADDIPELKKIIINNTLLQDYKQEQINIIHVIVDGNRKSTKLDFPANKAIFTF